MAWSLQWKWTQEHQFQLYDYIREEMETETSPIEAYVLLKAYTGQPIKVVGQAEVFVTYKEQEASLPLVVVEGEGPSLFGRNWLQTIQLDWKNIKAMILPDVNSILEEYGDLFSEQ